MEFAKTTILAKERLSRWTLYPFSVTSTISASSLNHVGKGDGSRQAGVTVTAPGVSVSRK
jgi:hypothetical protein